MSKKFMVFAVVLIGAFVACTCVFAEEKVVRVRVSSDSEAEGYQAYLAMDGDARSMWHTYFGGGGTRHPHEITIDLGEVYEISGFEYLPRTDGNNNGTIKDFEFYVSDDAKKFGEAFIKGTFKNSGAKNVVLFDGKSAKGRYVRLRALSEVGGKLWSSIAELRLICEGVRFVAESSAYSRFPKPANELEMQFENLHRDIKRRKHIMGHSEQVFNREAMILESDRDPLDVVLRRTGALLGDLWRKHSVSPLETELEKLRAESFKIDIEKTGERFELYKKACKLRRKIAFSNPLLDFDEMLFITRHRSGFNHMCDQYYGANTKPGGGLYVLSDPFGETPEVRDIVAGAVVEKGRLKGKRLEGGSFLSPDLSYDGKTVVFGYVECVGDTKHDYHVDPSRGHWDAGRCYHVFKINIDGTGLEQLTDGTWNDFDPCWLPNGRIAFISERRGGYLRCGRECPTYTLYDMNADGSDIRCLSPHETNEWHPSVTHDGMIVYTRWDYVDRHGCTVHLPWITTPDGRDARSVHGNFAPRELRADMELDIRAIPGSNKFVATGAPHHGQAFGSLVVFDPRIEDDDAMAPVKRLTPEVDFPETQGGAQVYGTVWPLSEKYYLCVYDSSMAAGAGRQGKKYIRGDYGIYLIDAFGNKELIYRDSQIASQNPMPLAARKTPPIVPDASERVAAGEDAEGTLALVNVYDSLKGWPEGTNIKSLRVYQIVPMSVPSGNPPHEIGLRLPTGTDSVILARYVLGEVPVEEDGSAHFTVPARKELFFQALDEKGLAVQSMRSGTYVQPGERLVCQGCHEPKNRVAAAAKKAPLAMLREPSKIKGDVDGTNPFSYPRLVQPVLEKNCLPCHQKHPEKAPRLDREVLAKDKKKNRKWFASYYSLAPEYGFWQYGDRHRTIPGKFGARASKLYKMLEKGHHDVKLSDEDMHRITVWLDSCSIFYGVYEADGGKDQLAGMVVHPTLE